MFTFRQCIVYPAFLSFSRDSSHPTEATCGILSNESRVSTCHKAAQECYRLHYPQSQEVSQQFSCHHSHKHDLTSFKDWWFTLSHLSPPQSCGAQPHLTPECLCAAAHRRPADSLLFWVLACLWEPSMAQLHFSLTLFWELVKLQPGKQADHTCSIKPWWFAVTPSGLWKKALKALY